MVSKHTLSICLDSHLRFASASFVFFFFPTCMNSNITWIHYARDKVHYSCTVHDCSCTVHGSHDTIYTFKKFFAIVFSVFSFQQNKLYPNGPLVYVWFQIKKSVYFTIQLIFTTIHGLYCTIWYYSWIIMYYFS